MARTRGVRWVTVFEGGPEDGLELECDPRELTSDTCIVADEDTPNQLAIYKAGAWISAMRNVIKRRFHFDCVRTPEQHAEVQQELVSNRIAEVEKKVYPE